MVRRRLSSDGYRLFNMAFPAPPTQMEKVKAMLTCLFRTEYDDKLDEMTRNCHKASRQLFGYHSDPIKRRQIPKYIDNSIFNVIYAVLTKDGGFANRFFMRQNFRYFSDVMYQAFQNEDQTRSLCYGPH